MVIAFNIIPGIKATIKVIMKDVTVMGSNVFNVRVGGRANECPSNPLNENWGKVTDTSTLPPEMHNQLEGSQEHQ